MGRWTTLASASAPERLSFLSMRYALFALLIFISFAPLTTHAAFGFTRIVPADCKCDSVPVEGGGSISAVPSAPAWGCVLQTVQNVIRVAIALGIALATLALIYAGFVWMTSGGSAEKRNQGSHLLINTFIGLFIMMGAWLIVDFVMKELYSGEKSGFGPWNNILAGNGESANRCIAVRQPTPIATGIVGLITDVSGGGGTGGAAGGPNMTGTNGCPNCVALREYGVSCQARGCTVDPRLATRLATLKRSYSGSWTVTEGYPPSRTHQNVCHQQGTCVDADITSGGYTAANFTAFNQAARAAGIRAVFESSTCSEVNTARAAGVEAACYGSDVISGSHFSLYGQ